ncbi:ExbD/TolR family protein [Tenacibaculum piscium]|uniref:ExbD/TolR family protein n=1 Tax=Tenacibaculum piscium TaxID=1458515 RepID=UPI001EFAD197|nr:biopolymer transporter ExbD [Tenacibaculum piscium]MCG8183847.1 biopolymer transporter ExbD [Tenacibaculum piscium]MCG8205227.1 biopolymer transporter ExbD [Tenacibaculum piscium]
MARRENPEINAGSMADIAFLLLIFFLVTTTMDVDSGIPKKLAENSDVVPPIVKEKNIFQVSINRNNQLFVENEGMELRDLKDAAVKFIDNGGGVGNPMPGKEAGTSCNYCKGAKDPASSDHPNKAIISVESDRGTEFGMYVAVQNELLKAYAELRNRLCQEKYGMSFTELEKSFTAGARKDDSLRKKVEDIKNSYPQIISDTEPTNVQ